MRIKFKNFIWIFAGFAAFLTASHASTPFSKYGVIQNVQNYSTNPFWDPSSPYNNTNMPQPVYATGPDVTTDECQRIVASLVTVQCMAQNNCVDTQLSDIRPAIMLQLSRMTGGNYATACGGYLDGIFNEYVNRYANAAPRGVPTSFPTATVPNPNINGNQIEIKNPLAPQKPDWAIEMQERKQELQDLQSQNGSGSVGLYSADFPTTYADLSFSERMANAQQGYEPFKDTKAYTELKIESEQEYLTRNKDTNSPDKKKVEEKEPKKEDNGLITEGIPEEFEALFPWYGILVVKAGSLDKYASLDFPIISTEYMKAHRDEFFPANSDKALGLSRGCTHSNHTAHDKDVINRATHITMGENDSFWSGSDYYVYDGKDVYWGWATIAGEVALALLTLGISAEASAAKAGIQMTAAGTKAIQTSSKAITAVKLTNKADKLNDAVKAAKAAKSGKNAAEVATRTKAIDALADAGITVKKGTSAKSLVNIGTALETAISTAKPLKWTSSLLKPWKLVASGAKNIVPTTKNLLGRGATWAKRFTTLGATGAVVGANYLGKEIIKAWGYSSAVLQDPSTGDVAFNSFGLLSDDDEEGRENVVSHGAWIQFNTIGTANEEDALNEAMRFAEELTKDINNINAQDPLCDVDIYVVQPAISNPEKIPGARSVYYILMNDDTKLQVRTK